MRATRFASLAIATAAAALLAACASRPVVINSYPSTVAAAPPAVVTVPAVTTVTPVDPVAIAPLPREYGRITNIEYVQSSVMGAGPVAGAPGTPVLAAVYRVTIHTDAGIWRSYSLSSTGDLRIGDRVRVENGVIFHA